MLFIVLKISGKLYHLKLYVGNAIIPKFISSFTVRKIRLIRNERQTVGLVLYT